MAAEKPEIIWSCNNQTPKLRSVEVVNLVSIHGGTVVSSLHHWKNWAFNLEKCLYVFIGLYGETESKFEPESVSRVIMTIRRMDNMS